MLVLLLLFSIQPSFANDVSVVQSSDCNCGISCHNAADFESCYDDCMMDCGEGLEDFNLREILNSAQQN